MRCITCMAASVRLFLAFAKIKMQKYITVRESIKYHWCQRSLHSVLQQLHQVAARLSGEKMNAIIIYISKLFGASGYKVGVRKRYIIFLLIMRWQACTEQREARKKLGIAHEKTIDDLASCDCDRIASPQCTRNSTRARRCMLCERIIISNWPITRQKYIGDNAAH